MVARPQDHHARAAAPRNARRRDAHGLDTRRISRRNRGLSHAAGNARGPAHAHRSGDRRRVHTHAAERSGTRRSRRGAVRRVSRAQPARRHGARLRARLAGEPEPRFQAAGDVRDTGRSGGRRVVRRCAGGHRRGARASGEHSICGHRTAAAAGWARRSRARRAAGHQACADRGAR